jgi:hypothetical protein
MAKGEISKSMDVAAMEAPDYKSGCLPLDNPGITPDVQETPGWKATNDPAATSINKAQPAGAGGSGYTKGS